jgi:signal transduction histidine kinase
MILRKQPYIVIILLIGFCSAFSQTRVIDSLEDKLSGSLGTAKVDVLNQLTYECINRDSMKVREYFNESLALAKQLGYQKGVGRAFTYKGVALYLAGEFIDGRYNLRKGLNLAIESNDRSNEGYSLLQLGNSFVNQGQADSALFFYQRSYGVLKDSSNAVNLSKLYSNMSLAYGLRSDFNREKQYIRRSLEIREKMGDKTLITDALILLADMNIREGNLTLADRNLDKAEVLLVSNPEDQENLNDWRHQKALMLLHKNKYQEALVLFDSAISYYSRASLLKNYVVLQSDLGKIFNNRGEYGIALKCFEDGLKVAESKGYDVEIADINLQIGWAYLNLGELDQSVELAKQTLLWGEKNNIPSRIGDALILSGINFCELKDFEKSKKCFDRALSIRKQLKDNAKISQAYENLGYLERSRGNYNASINYYQTSLVFADSAAYNLGKIWSMYGLGQSNRKLGRLDVALKYLDLAEVLARANNAKEALAYIYREKRELYKSGGDYKQAVYYSERSFELRDSLSHSSLGNRFASLQRYQEIRQKEREIRALSEEKKLAQARLLLQGQTLEKQYYLIFFAVALIMLLGALAFVYARFYFRVKRLNVAINQQKDEIQIQSSYIHQLNKNLEAIVAEKTKDIQTTNQELIKQNNELLQFSYTVSHNLRGPVARLLGLTNIMQYAKSAEERNQMVDRIRQASRDLDATLKDVSKVIDVTNDLHQSNEWVSLHEEWAKSNSALEEVMKDSFRISADFENADKLFTLKAFIQSVFFNLLSNAIKYRSDERDLEVCAFSRKENGNIIIEVKDNGLGMDVDRYKDSVFKLFKRFHTHVEGRGLGLYLVKTQVEALNGTVEILSQVGKGTLFVITLPQTHVDSGKLT